jgi:hypothetical protein
MTTAPDILARAQAGDGDAAVMLSRLLDREGRYDEALQWLAKAANAGHLLASTVLGARLVSARGAPHDPARGADFIHRAAAGGQADAAAYASVLAATGVGRTQDWEDALAGLLAAASMGHARSQAALPVAREQSVADWLAPPAPQPFFADPGEPQILKFPGFVSPSVCDWIIGQSKDYLRPAPVYNASGAGLQDQARTNSGTGFSLLDLDVVFALVRARIAAAIPQPIETLETTNVLHYAVGQKFSPHFDFIDPATPELAADVAQKGQRTGTFLIYLNDGYSGGETDFPLLKQQVKGAKGDGLYFSNVDASGNPDPRTYHAGLPPTAGEKWVLSQWMRTRPQLQL